MNNDNQTDWDSLDWHKVRIDRADLVDWLAKTGSNPAFFKDEIDTRKKQAESNISSERHGPHPAHFPQALRQKVPDYLDPTHPRYAYKLAAAVLAWQAVTDQPRKTPSQTLTAWLESHAAKLGLIKKDGAMNKTGIEEIAKIANWKTEGGAPKTPG